jgi:adenylate cyclase
MGCPTFRRFLHKLYRMHASAPATSAAPTPRPRILVVDDSPMNLFLIQSLLEDRFEVLQAAGGHEALQLAEQGPRPELMLLDIVMPDMDGYEVLRRLRQHPPTAGIPVVFFSSLAEEHEQRLGMDLGAIDYLTKPVDPQAVLSRVERHVRAAARSRRIDALGERLSRHLAPRAWHQLFHGVGGVCLSFEQEPRTLLTIQAAQLNGSSAGRAAFCEEVEAMAGPCRGTVDHFGWGELVVMFDEPRDALQMALDLQRQAGGSPMHLGLHHCVCDFARFRGMGGWERTLLGDEAKLARAVTAGATRGIVISPEAYALLRPEVQARRGQVVVTEKFQGGGLRMACVTSTL